MGLFDKRVNYKPFEYGYITDPLINAMWASHWTHNEFNFNSDIQDFKSKLTDEEREIIKRTTLLISSIEVSVKSYWGNLGKVIPIPEIADMGAVFGGVEVIHSRAYSQILSKLGFEDDFETLFDNEFVKNRSDYLNKYLNKIYKNDRKNIVYSLVLFTLFTEYCALFSQFYIILGFNRYKGVFKDIANIVQYTAKEENCFIDGTEVLTVNGWVDLKEVSIGDSVIAYSEGVSKIEKVVNKTESEFEGSMVKLSNSKVVSIMTPDHDMITYTEDKGYHKTPISKTSFNSKRLIPVTTDFQNGGVSEMTDEERLKVALQADGHKTYWINTQGEKKYRGIDGGYNYSVNLKKSCKKERLKELLIKTGTKYKVSDNEKGFSVFSIHIETSVDMKKFDWVDLSRVDKYWCSDFIKEILFWDGYTSDKEESYWSIEKSCADVVQAIGVLAGYRVSLNSRQDDRKESYSEGYKVRFYKKDISLIASHSYIKEDFSYSGKVRCITVPSGGIITRYKDTTLIVGNCHAEGGIAIINKIREEYPELFDEELESRIYEEVRVAFEAEGNLANWILQGYENEFLSEDILKGYVKRRMNDCLSRIGYEPQFKISVDTVKKTDWMEEEVYMPIMTDFFHKKPTDYSKKTQSITDEDLF